MAQHTPGPWRWESYGVIVDHEGHPVCRLADHGRIEANARLIALSPTLLAIAHQVAEHFADTDSSLGESARAAIRKAEEG